MAELRIDVHDTSNTSSPAGTLEQAYARRMLADLYGPGSATFAVDHASTADMALVDHRSIVRFLVRDRQGAWQTREGFIVTDFDDVIVDDVPVRVFRCQGIMSILGYDRGGGLLHPRIDLALRRNPREFGYRDQGADKSDWVEPDNQGRWRSPFNPDARGKPVGWPDQDDGQWIGHEQDFNVISRDLDLDARPDKLRPTWLFASGQAAWRMFVDGRLMASGGAYDVAKIRYRWTNPLHTVTLECEDGPMIWCSTVIEPDGRVGGILYRTFTTDVFGTGDPHPWRTGPTRGVNRGYIEGIVGLDEAKARGELPWVTRGFDDVHDSNNQEWQDTIIHGFRLQTLGRLNDDVGTLLPGESWMTPQGEFNIAQRRGQDRSGQITVAMPFGARISHDGPRLTRGLFETPDGYGIIPPNATAEAQYGPMADMITYGTALRPDHLEDAVMRDVLHLSTSRAEADVEFPDDVIPYEDCGLGDTVRVQVGLLDEDMRVATFELADSAETGVAEWAGTVVPDE